MNAMQEINCLVKKAYTVPADVDRHIWNSIQPGLGDDKLGRRIWLFNEGDKYARRGSEGAKYSKIMARPDVERGSFAYSMSRPLSGSRTRYKSTSIAGGPPASSPYDASKPFDFRSEAAKLLKSYGANASRAGGAYSTDLGRQMSEQWRDMQQNPGKYDESRQRQILEQWKGNIAKMRSAQKPRPHSYAGTDAKGNATYLNAQGRQVALSQLPSMQMAQKWNQPYMDTPANRARGFAGLNPIKPKQDAAQNTNQVASM